VLDAHGTPDVDLEAWEFEVGGLVENRLKWSLDEFMRLPAVRVFADFHCVTRWSRLDNVWSGVSTREVARLAGVRPEARFVSVAAHDYGWTTNLPIEYFLAEDSLFAWSNDGRPIPPEHGGPVRLVVPQLYAWKSAKWVKAVRFLAEDEAGFWEEGGYHMRGNPWEGRDGERFRWQEEE
jgi:DMSO/TMAO reductase YedYZ molybdopterin-dependent catalytic subunit